MAGASSTATDTAMSGATTRGSMLPGPPPPTPSNQQLPSASAGVGADAALSSFLHRMLLSSPAPRLRSPPRTRSQAPPALPPLVSLDAPDPGTLRDGAGTGYFHVASHGVPSELPSAALAELARIDASARRESTLRALGFSEEEEEEEQGADGDPAVVFDASEKGEMDDVLPGSVAEYARRMRDAGMRVVALLSGCPDAGFREDPFADGKRSARCLVWASKVPAGETAAPPAAGQGKGKAYPYVVGLHCQWEAAGQEAAAPASWVMDDGGEWTSVGARDGAILVTIGDIAQVWSNGDLRKVRGMTRPAACAAPSKGEGQQRGEPAERLSVTVLITLSLDSVVSPLVPCSDQEARDVAEDGVGGDDDRDEWRFHSFLLEDYAWRVYHQRLQFKDPLVRYRI